MYTHKPIGRESDLITVILAHVIYFQRYLLTISRGEYGSQIIQLFL